MTNKFHIDVLDKGFIELVNVMGNDHDIAQSARISIMSNQPKKTDRELIKYLIDKGHTSPFEQVEFRFLVKCPIFVARQWMRHRTWSYNELSRRYTDAELEFYIAEDLFESEKNSFKYIYEEATKTYDILTKGNNVEKELARALLPVGLYTTFYAKTDLHNLFHFLELRRTEHAQFEIVLYTEAIEKFVSYTFPMSYDAWKEKQVG